MRTFAISEIVHALSVLAALGMLAACTTSSTSSTSSTSTGTTVGTRSPAPAGAGTEVIEASTANPQAASVAVRASGVFTDTGTLKLPIGNPRTITFKLTRGDLTMLNATGPANGPLHLNKTTCAYSQSVGGTYRVLSGSSTSSYAGATGHGTYALNSGGIAPKTPSGMCDTGSDATPGKALFVILFRGLLVLNEGS